LPRLARTPSKGSLPQKVKTHVSDFGLTHEYAENGMSFDPMELLGMDAPSRALDLPWHFLSARTICMNPNDVLFPTMPNST
jgi:hypothetical protein